MNTHPLPSMQDIFINGLVDYLGQSHKYAFRNRSHSVVTFFYGDDIKNLKKYKLLKNNIQAKLPFNTIIKILKEMTNQRPPSDDVQPGEHDPILPTHYKYVVKWINKSKETKETTVGAESATDATKIIGDHYPDFESHIETRRVN
jgi:hypothetical protein